MKKALVRRSDGTVVNVIEHDEKGNYEPPEGIDLLDVAQHAEPRGTWDGSEFQPAPSTLTIKQEIAAAMRAEELTTQEALLHLLEGRRP